MSRWLSFDFDAEKFVHTACYLVARCPDVTKMKLFKLLYFADKRHLLTCGRPIIGDRYLKMDYGPVPSRAYNLIKHDDLAKPEDDEWYGLANKRLNTMLTSKDSTNKNTK